MKIIFLGTNGWYDTATGNTVCTLIETKKEYIILDAGNGLYKIDRYIKTEKPIYLFLSHFHFDHIIGLHALNKFSFSQGISVYGPPGTKDVLGAVINQPYTVPLAELPFKVELFELSEGEHNIPFSVKCRALLHSWQCFGYRIELEEKIVAYCPDTGACDNAVELAEEADLLIAECSFKSGQYCQEWPHLNPEEAAKIAAKAGVKKLVLIHFDANIYQTLLEREEAQEKAREIFNNTFAAKDDDSMEI